jgi:hypothetical protein
MRVRKGNEAVREGKGEKGEIKKGNRNHSLPLLNFKKKKMIMI